MTWKGSSWRVLSSEDSRPPEAASPVPSCGGLAQFSLTLLSIHLGMFFQYVHNYTDADVRVLAKQFWIDGKFPTQFWHLVPLTCSNIPKFLSLLPTWVVLRVQRYDLECWACTETIRRENKTGVHTVMRFKLYICCLVIKFMALSPIWFQDWII